MTFIAKQHCATDLGWPVRLMNIPIPACRTHQPPQEATTVDGNPNVKIWVPNILYYWHRWKCKRQIFNVEFSSFCVSGMLAKLLILFKSNPPDHKIYAWWIGFKGNVQLSCEASEGVAQTVRVPSYGGGGIWPNRHTTFIVAQKA